MTQAACNLLRIYKASRKLEDRSQAIQFLTTFIDITIRDLEDDNKLTNQNVENAILERANWTEKAVAKELRKAKRKTTKAAS